MNCESIKNDFYLLNPVCRYMSGEETADLILNKFLSNFESEGSVDGKVSRLVDIKLTLARV